jgi:hypothetical protein
MLSKFIMFRRRDFLDFRLDFRFFQAAETEQESGRRRYGIHRIPDRVRVFFSDLEELETPMRRLGTGKIKPIILTATQPHNFDSVNTILYNTIQYNTREWEMNKPSHSFLVKSNEALERLDKKSSVAS